MTKTFKFSLGTIALFLALAVIFSLPGSGEARGGNDDETKTSSSTKESRFDDRAKTSSSTKSVDATCMQTAIGVREASLLVAFTDFNSDITDALNTRKSALNAAWGLSDVSARNSALKAAWETWKTDSKAAHKTLKDSRKKAWETFKSSVKTSCKVSLPKEESLRKDLKGEIVI